MTKFPQRMRLVSVFTVISFILFTCPSIFSSEEGEGNLIGFIFQEDGTTPVKGAVLKIRNIATAELLESEKSDENGIVKIQGIEQGMYVAGVTSNEGNFNFKNIIGIESNSTEKLSIALKPGGLQGEEGGKGGFVKFLGTPLGIAVILAATGGIIYTIVKLTEKEEEASPFKK